MSTFSTLVYTSLSLNRIFFSRWRKRRSVEREECCDWGWNIAHCGAFWRARKEKLPWRRLNAENVRFLIIFKNNFSLVRISQRRKIQSLYHSTNLIWRKGLELGGALGLISYRLTYAGSNTNFNQRNEDITSSKFQHGFCQWNCSCASRTQSGRIFKQSFEKLFRLVANHKRMKFLSRDSRMVNLT